RPDIYLAQRVRVVFVFREPNLRDDPYELDMRAQIRDPEFRAMHHGDYRKPATRRGWWNWKVGCLAHAVVGALAGRSPEQGFAQFDALIRRGHRAHEFLFPFGFMQIKKVGGSDESRGDEIAAHARTYSDVLRQQLALYEPHLVIACGLGDR